MSTPMEQPSTMDQTSESSSVSTILTSISLWANESSTPGEVNAALQSLIQQSGSIDQLTQSQLQQLVTLDLQSHLALAGTVPSAAQPHQHQYRLLLERLHNVLLNLSPSQAMYDTLENIIQAHTPAPSSSRRSSFSATTAGAPLIPTAATVTTAAAAAVVRSRRNSLVQPLEEEAVASMRLQAFKFVFEWTRMAATKQTANGDAPTSADLPTFSLRMHLKALADVWSAIRKAAASDLGKRGGVVNVLVQAGLLQEAFERMMQLAGLSVIATGNDVSDTPILPQPTWQQQEGAIAGIAALFSALRSIVVSTSSASMDPSIHAPHRSLLAFLPSLSPSRFLPMLSHPQLTVREFVTTALTILVELLGGEVKQQLVDSFLERLKEGMMESAATTDTSSASHQHQQQPSSFVWLSDYESEGCFAVILALLSGPQSVCPSFQRNSSWWIILEHYLAHPASSVRQKVAEVVATLASKQASTSGAADGGHQAAEENRFDLIQSLVTPAWNWTVQESLAREENLRTHIPTEIHAPVVFFALPPPLRARPPAATVHSRRTSRADETPATGEPVSSSAQSTSSAPAPSRPDVRSTWQWKEGALMSLELFLRSNPPSHATIGLHRLLESVCLASGSHSWELRRMADQVWRPFLAVWTEREEAGKELIHLLESWLGAAGGVQPPTHQPTIQQAVCATPALQAVLGHLHHSAQIQHTASTGASDDPGAGDERKWNQDSVAHSHTVHPRVWSDLAEGLPGKGILGRIEHLALVAEVLEHALDASPAPAVAHPSHIDPSLHNSFVGWDQVATMAVQNLVTAFATLGGSSSASKKSHHHSMRLSSQSTLQYFSCILDRLRLVRALVLGIDSPAPSVPAQMILQPQPGSPRVPPAAAVASPLSPHHLPTIAPVQTTTPTVSQTAVGLLAVPRAVNPIQIRAKAKVLESWLLSHLCPFLPGFASHVPPAARVDLLDLLRDWLDRYHSSTTAGAAEVRVNLLRALEHGWDAPSPPVHSLQMHSCVDACIATFSTLLQENPSDRVHTVSAFRALVRNAELHVAQLARILQSIAACVKDDYLSISLSSPPPPSPEILLSPTSAAIAAEVEQWDDWDEDDPAETEATGTNVSGGAPQSASELFAHAKQVVLDFAPLLLDLAGQSYSASLSDSSSTGSTLVSTSKRLSGPQACTSPEPASHRVHGQSSLAQLVEAYEHGVSHGEGNSSRQLELLGWIQQWASQVQSSLTSSSSGSTSTPAATPSTPLSFSIHHRMPINQPFASTLDSLPESVRSKLRWLQDQGQQDETRNSTLA